MGSAAQVLPPNPKNSEVMCYNYKWAHDLRGKVTFSSFLALHGLVSRSQYAQKDVVFQPQLGMHLLSDGSFCKTLLKKQPLLEVLPRQSF